MQQNTSQSITIRVVVACQREPVCDELGCRKIAVAFDACRLMFVCADHKRRRVGVRQ
jgi:hypothetical protein